VFGAQTVKELVTMTRDEWLAEAERRFGPDPMNWRFVCPVCKHVASVADWRDAGAPEGAVAYSCVGRWLAESSDAFTEGSPGPCNYAGGGLFRLNPIEVDGRGVFDFAEEID
jgi:hypothetical protein